MKFSRELTAASAKPIVLSILAQGETYGYEIIQKVRELSDNEIRWTEGALYPVLYRLERKGMIESEWKNTPQGRKRRYYRLKQAGHKALSLDRLQWKITNNTMDRLWGPEASFT